MFRTFAKFITTLEETGAIDLMHLHPSDLTALLELAWDRGSNNAAVDLGDPVQRSDACQLQYHLVWTGGFRGAAKPPPPPTGLMLSPLRDPQTPIGDAGRERIEWDPLGSP